jgi:hypothetical protein
MSAVDIIVFITIMSSGILFFVLSIKNREKKKKVFSGEDPTDVFLRHLDGL